MENSTKTSQKAGQSKEFSFFDLATNLLSGLPDRSQEIVKKRFGIGQKEPQTLEKIGKEHGITRERVRQIIADALKKISQQKENSNFTRAEEKIAWTIEKNDGIMEENRIVDELSEGDRREADAIVFFGNSSDKVDIFEEKGLIKKSWIISKNVISKVKEVESLAKEIFKKSNKLLTDAEIAEQLAAKKPSFSKEQILNYLDVLATVKKNKFKKWGISEWEEISPKGTKERIYVILKEQNKPLHFTEIAKLIDEYKLGKRKAHPQTVHNELIKDDRYVLVGRGIYALREWGYEKGTIKDVLENILRSRQKPMTKDEIIREVLQKRKVKKATIMINLNNQKVFIKQDNRYSVKK